MRYFFISKTGQFIMIKIFYDHILLMYYPSLVKPTHFLHE